MAAGGGAEQSERTRRVAVLANRAENDPEGWSASRRSEES